MYTIAHELRVRTTITYSLNAVEWKSTLFGVILGITSFGVESTPKL